MSDLFPLKAIGAESAVRGAVLVGPIDLELGSTGACIVMGPNGAGKTTLLRLLHGAARLTKGEIHWACETETARRRQAFVFQRPIMLRRSVRDNLSYPLRVRGVPREEALSRARDWAKRVGLDPMLDRSATVLSGGEQQKLALARALIAEPEVLFLDEPCASLDGRAMREIEDILLQAKSQGTKLIMSTHDLGQARRLADEVIFMLAGQIKEHKPATEFFEMPDTAQAQSFLRGDIVE